MSSADGKVVRLPGGQRPQPPRREVPDIVRRIADGLGEEVARHRAEPVRQRSPAGRRNRRARRREQARGPESNTVLIPRRPRAGAAASLTPSRSRVGRVKISGVSARPDAERSTWLSLAIGAP